MSASNSDDAWHFDAGTGLQGAFNKNYPSFYVMAVRAGDVAATPVPEVDSVMLVALGMGLIGRLARRRG